MDHKHFTLAWVHHLSVTATQRRNSIPAPRAPTCNNSVSTNTEIRYLSLTRNWPDIACCYHSGNNEKSDMPKLTNWIIGQRPATTMLAQHWTKNGSMAQYLLSKHDILTQCWGNVGPPSLTLGQHCPSIWSMSRVCWGAIRWTRVQVYIGSLWAFLWRGQTMINSRRNDWKCPMSAILDCFSLVFCRPRQAHSS